MRFSEWLETVPDYFKSDALWKMSVYRYALFLADVSWLDMTKLGQERRTRDLSSQLYEAVGSISANIAEGYSRSSGKDRTRFYEYSLGSARESRDWCFKGRHVLDAAAVEHRQQLLTEIIRLLLSIIPQERTHNLREEQAEYLVTSEAVLESLLENAPLP